MEASRRAMFVQGAYYLATGVAPFVSRRAFEAVTGRKRGGWLVETGGVGGTGGGPGIPAAAARDRVPPEITTIAVGCAGGLAAIDVVYVARGRISPAYLADAAAQVGLLAAHAAGSGNRPGRPGSATA